MGLPTRAEVVAAFSEDAEDWIIDPASPYFIQHQHVKSLRVIYGLEGGADPWCVIFDHRPKGRYLSVAAAAQRAREFLK